MTATEKIINQEIAHDIAWVIQISLWAEWCACPHTGIVWWKTSRGDWERTYHINDLHDKIQQKNPDRKPVAFLFRGGLDADHRQYFQWIKIAEKIGDEWDNGDTSLFWGHASGDATKGTATFHCFTREEFCEGKNFPPEEACVFTVSHNLTERAKQWLVRIETRALRMLEAEEVWDIGNSPLARFIQTDAVNNEKIKSEV